jgi:hypothetical protein
MARIASRFVDFGRRQQLRDPRIDRTAYYAKQSRLPVSIPRDTLAIVGSKEDPKWAVFECPCGTGHTIMLNMSSARRPFWRLAEGSLGPSLLPSVDFCDGYTHCHLWLRDGVVRFARDSQRQRRKRSRPEAL